MHFGNTPFLRNLRKRESAHLMLHSLLFAKLTKIVLVNRSSFSSRTPFHLPPLVTLLDLPPCATTPPARSFPRPPLIRSSSYLLPFPVPAFIWASQRPRPSVRRSHNAHGRSGIHRELHLRLLHGVYFRSVTTALPHRRFPTSQIEPSPSR